MAAPQFPDHVIPEGHQGVDNKAEIAAAAWAQSNGSVAAFEQLCREHLAGELDVLAIQAERDAGQAVTEEGEAATRGTTRPKR